VENSVFYISNIVMYYNTTASANYNGTCAASCTQACSAADDDSSAQVSRRHVVDSAHALNAGIELSTF